MSAAPRAGWSPRRRPGAPGKVRADPASHPSPAPEHPAGSALPLQASRTTLRGSRRSSRVGLKDSGAFRVRLQAARNAACGSRAPHSGALGRVVRLPRTCFRAPGAPPAASARPIPGGRNAPCGFRMTHFGRWNTSCDVSAHPSGLRSTSCGFRTTRSGKLKRPVRLPHDPFRKAETLRAASARPFSGA
jgi:hypothetical protein